MATPPPLPFDVRADRHDRATVRVAAPQTGVPVRVPLATRHARHEVEPAYDRRETCRLGPFRRACRPWELVVPHEDISREIDSAKG